MLELDFGLFLQSFIFGLLTPLGAVCVLPLYPGFLAYISNQVSTKTSKLRLFFLGLLVVSGVISFMLVLGLLFTTILQQSLTNVIEVVSPIAFGILAIISILLIFNIDFTRFLPQFHSPVTKNPYLSSFIFGFFFGAIVLPCNPGFIAAFFARALLVSSPISNLLNFISFGLGLGFPLQILSIISSVKGNAVVNFLAKHKKKVNLIAGSIMLGISIYYLFFVFNILNF